MFVIIFAPMNQKALLNFPTLNHPFNTRNLFHFRPPNNTVHHIYFVAFNHHHLKILNLQNCWHPLILHTIDLVMLQYLTLPRLYFQNFPPYSLVISIFTNAFAFLLTHHRCGNQIGTDFSFWLHSRAYPSNFCLSLVKSLFVSTFETI